MNPQSDCQQVRLAAMALADGETPELASGDVQSHLQECLACRGEVEQLDIGSLFPAGVRWSDASESIWQRIAGQVTQKQESAPTNRWGGGRAKQWWAVAAVIALVAGGSMWLFPRNRKHAPDDNRRSTVDTDTPSSKDPPSPSLRKNENDGELILLSLSESAAGRGGEVAGAPAPFGAEAWADDVALAKIGDVFERDGKKFFRLEIIESYKGRFAGHRIDAADLPVVVGLECCGFARRIAWHSDILKPGTRVSIYLKNTEEHGWRVTSLSDVPGDEDWWRSFTKRFCEVQTADESDDPAARYRELLPTDREVLLDPAACVALSYNPSPHALPVIRRLWDRAVARSNEAVPRGDGGILLVDLLSRMHDVESVDSVLQYGLRQEPSQQLPYFRALPGLCRYADPAVIRRVRGELKKVLDTQPTEDEVKETGDVNQINDYYVLRGAYDQLGKLLEKPKPIEHWKPTAAEIESLTLLGPPPESYADSSHSHSEIVESDVIAVGLMHRPFELDGKKMQRVDLTEFVKGELPPKNGNADEMPRMCGFPVTKRSWDPTEEIIYEPGCSMAVHLKRRPMGDWVTVRLHELGRQEGRWQEWVRRFLEVYGACNAKDPATRYRQLLAPDDRAEIDLLDFDALWWNPDPRAADVVREIIQRSLATTGRPWAGKTRHPLELLSRMHDAKSIDLFIEYIDKLSLGERGNFYAWLPDLCKNADKADIERVRVWLKKFLAQHDRETVRKSNDHKLMGDYFEASEAYLALGKLLDR